MRRRRAIMVAGVGAVAIGGGLVAAGHVTAVARTQAVVNPGQSIQAAIDAASPGTTITVTSGTYAENLLIDKSRITLRGDGDVTLVPPEHPNLVCGETADAVDGICVAHILRIGANGPVTSTVHDVRITNFTIAGFSDAGILMFNNAGAHVDHMHLKSDGGYGAFALQSTDTTFNRNVAENNQEAGFYIGESPDADATVTYNVSKGNMFGVFFRDSRAGTITHNTTSGNCAGIILLNTGQGSGVGDATVQDNTANENNKACPAGEGPPVSGVGIAVVSGDHITIEGNEADRNVASGPTIASAGILLTPGRPGSPPVTNTSVVENTAHDNATDIDEVVPDASNTFTDNHCTTSNPAGLCAA